MQGEREGDPFSSQSLPTTTACPAARFSSLPPSQQKLNQNQQRVPLWTCDRKRKLRSWGEAEQLPRGKGEGAGMCGKKLIEEREPREKEGEGKPEEGEKELYQTVYKT